ncbi:ICOS ligand-like [Pseudochaenichthys georgianus]|uniref:ICOS ligand-like n=1 Tax=Pseudochaenichthys georgianus TaxID=52239 RepID=UPI00146F2EA9|nr:butyrophilin-like protein 8 [Pseudochaenichthys georgianus]
MAALTSAQHAGLVMFLWIIGSLAAGDSEEMKAKPGQDVTLQCSSSTDAAVTVLEWKRPERERYVFYFRDNRLIETYQDPRYRGRVQLKDPEMKNGNASVLLKNVDIKDTGTYECRVVTLSNNRRKRNVRVFERSVLLTVSEGPEQPGGPKKEINDEQPEGSRGLVGLGVSVGLVCLVVVVVVGAGLVVKSKRAKEKRPSESVDEQVNAKLNP